MTAGVALESGIAVEIFAGLGEAKMSAQRTPTLMGFDESASHAGTSVAWAATINALRTASRRTRNC